MGGIFVLCLALWDRNTFSFSSLRLWVVVVSFSEAKAGDNGVLSLVAGADPQLLCDGGKTVFCSF